MLNRKQKAIIIAALLTVSVSAGSLAPYTQTARASWQAAQTAADGQITKEQMVERAVRLYEQLSGKTADENIIKAAQELNIITADESGLLADSTAISKQDSARLLYNAVLAYDSSFSLTEEEISAILSDCYDNTYIDPQNRAAMAFLLKYGAVAPQTRANPYAALPNRVAEQITTDISNEFSAKDSITVGVNTVSVGEAVSGVLARFGTPNRIDPDEYGFDWYVYNADYENFIMIGIEGGKVCAFFSNAANLEYHGIKKSSDVTEQTAAKLIFAADGTLDSVYYVPETTKSESTDEILACSQSRLIDIINSYRAKKSLPLLIENSEMTNTARAYSSGAQYIAASGMIHMTDTAYDILDFYETKILSGEYSNIFDGLVKHNCYTGLGITSTAEGISAALISDPNTTIHGERQITTADLDGAQTPSEAVENTVPVIAAPANEQVYEYGQDITISLEAPAANRYLVQMLNTETDEYAVNSYITTSQTELTFPSSLFDDGADYIITVSAADGDELLMSEPVTVVYGYSKPPVMLSPIPNAILSEKSVTVSWQSDLYSDFRLELYRDGQPACSARVSGEYSTQLMDLQSGTYMLGVSALRKNTNVVKNTSWIKFSISELPVLYETQYITRDDGTIQEVQVPVSISGKTRFSSDKYARIFGGPQVYTSKEQADADMQVITVPVWKMKSDGTKYSSSATLTIHKNLAADVSAIFKEIYNGPEQFPIKSAGGYNWRSTATGSVSQHSYGTCIDINPDENYCLYRSGRQIGSFWKPYDNPYSITPDGDVMHAFVKYGWAWGGNWNSVKDYMHFSYLGR